MLLLNHKNKFHSSYSIFVASPITLSIKLLMDYRIKANYFKYVAFQRDLKSFHSITYKCPGSPTLV